MPALTQHTDSSLPLRCVIADDVPVIRDVVRMSLDLLGWVDVCGGAAHGEAALELITQQRHDVAIIDTRMPKLSGFSVASKVRDLDLPVAIIMFTAFADEGIHTRSATLDVQLVNKLDGVPGLHAALDRIRRERTERRA